MSRPQHDAAAELAGGDPVDHLDPAIQYPAHRVGPRRRVVVAPGPLGGVDAQEVVQLIACLPHAVGADDVDQVGVDEVLDRILGRVLVDPQQRRDNPQWKVWQSEQAQSPQRDAGWASRAS